MTTRGFKQNPLIQLTPEPLDLCSLQRSEEEKNSEPKVEATDKIKVDFKYQYPLFTDKNIWGKIVHPNHKPDNLISITTDNNGVSVYFTDDKGFTSVYDDDQVLKLPCYVTNCNGNVYYCDAKGEESLYCTNSPSITSAIFGKKMEPKGNPNIQYHRNKVDPDAYSNSDEEVDDKPVISLSHVNKSVKKELELPRISKSNGKKVEHKLNKDGTTAKKRRQSKKIDDNPSLFMYEDPDSIDIEALTKRYGLNDFAFKKLMDDSLNGIHANLIPVVKYKFNGEIFRTDIKAPMVFFWDKHTRLWVECFPKELKNLIMEDILPIYKAYLSIYNVKISNLINEGLSEGDNKFDTTETKRKLIYVMVNKLGSNPYLTSFIEYFITTIVDKTGTFVDKLDADTSILAVGLNRVIDLKTGELRERVIDDYCTKAIKRHYNPNANKEKTIEFFNTIMLGNKELINRLQMILGYCLTGSQALKTFFVFSGSGNNGKSVLTNILEKILGPYFRTLEQDIISQYNTDKINPSAHKSHIIHLKGSRLGVTNDINSKITINTSLIRAFTGNDTQSARGAYESTYTTFNPENKFIICCNETPELSEKTVASYRRLNIFPFLCEFVEYPDTKNKPYQKKIDINFTDNFINNDEAMDGFFAWLVEGAVIFYKGTEHHPPVPELVINATNEFRQNDDYFQRFIYERLVLPPKFPKDNGTGVRYIPDGKVEDKDGTKENWRYGASDLYSTFQNWLGDNNINHKDPSLSSVKFGIKMKTLLDCRRDGNGKIIYVCRDRLYDVAIAQAEQYNPNAD